MDNEILYGDAAFDGISDSDDEDTKSSKRPQPTRRSNRGHQASSASNHDDTEGVDKEWRCRDGERF